MRSSPSANWNDRRREPRGASLGTAVLIAGESAPRIIEARLVDRSPSGFRLVHSDPELETGERVRFTIGNYSGEAIVVWRRTFENHIECGLMIEQSVD